MRATLNGNELYKMSKEGEVEGEKQLLGSALVDDSSTHATRLIGPDSRSEAEWLLPCRAMQGSPIGRIDYISATYLP